MKKIILSILFVSGSVYANKPAYKIAMDTSINGIKTSSTITVKDGDNGSVQAVEANLGGRFTEVTARKTFLDGKPAVHMEFVVGEVDRFGNKTIIATPKITSVFGERSSVMIGSAAGGKKLVFSATAQPIKMAQKNKAKK